MGRRDNDDYEELLHKMESKVNNKPRKSRRFKEEEELKKIKEDINLDKDYDSDEDNTEEDDKAYRKATKKELKKQQKEEKKAEKRKKKKRHIIRKIFLAFFILLLIAIIVFAIFIVKNGGGLKGILTTIVGSNAEQVANLEDLTFLAVGKSQGMTDTIMVMKYSPKNQTLSMVSIQRDTYTGSNDATATASDKINAKYPIGGIQSLLRAVNSLTGLNLKKYVVVDTKALRDLVDVIGGVDFDVPIDMDYDDCTQDLAIHLKAGMQHLNGEQAEGVVRFRHNNNGTSYPVEYGDNDFGRMKTQRAFIMATMKQALNLKNAFKIGDIMKIIEEQVETNMEWDSIKNYLVAALDFNTDNIRSTALPGSTGSRNGYSFFFAYKNEAKKVIKEYFLDNVVVNDESSTDGNSVDENTVNETNTTNTIISKGKWNIVDVEKGQNAVSTVEVSKPNSQVKINLVNGTGETNRFNAAATQLTNAGYKVTKGGKTNFTEKTIIIDRNNNADDVDTQLASILCTGMIQNSPKDNGYDYTVIIGNDY